MAIKLLASIMLAAAVTGGLTQSTAIPIEQQLRESASIKLVPTACYPRPLYEQYMKRKGMFLTYHGTHTEIIQGKKAKLRIEIWTDNADEFQIVAGVKEETYVCSLGTGESLTSNGS